MTTYKCQLQQPATRKATDAKYIQFTKTKGTIYHHLHLKNRYTACTKPRTRNPPQSQNKNKSKTKIKHRSGSPAWVKSLRNGSFFVINRSKVIQQYPCYFERTRK